MRASAHAPVATGWSASYSLAPRPWDLLLVATTVYLLTGVARLHVLLPGLHLLHPAVLAAAAGLFAILAAHEPERSVDRLRHPLALCLAGVLGWATVGAPAGLYAGNSVIFLFSSFYKTALLFVMIATAVRDVVDLRRMLGVYAAGAVIFSAFTALPGSYRAIGGGGYDANDSAMFVVSALPLAAYFALRSRTAGKRALWLAGTAVCAIALVKSGSRGGFLAFLAVVLYMLAYARTIRLHHRLAGVVAIVVVLALAAASQPDYWERMRTLLNLEEDYNTTELAGRKQIWLRGIGYTLDRPIFGVGINNFSVAEGQHPRIVELLGRGVGVKFSAPHSIWVQAAAELGIPGFVAFVSAFAIVWFGVRRLGRLARARGDPAAREMAEMGEAVGGVLVAVAVAGTFLSQAYSANLWAVFGLAMALFKVAPGYLAVPVPAPFTAAVAAPRGAPWLRPSVLYRADAWRRSA